MYGWWNLGNNVSGIAFNLVVVAFFAVCVIGIGFLVYAAKQLKKREEAAESKAD